MGDCDHTDRAPIEVDAQVGKSMKRHTPDGTRQPGLIPWCADAGVLGDEIDDPPGFGEEGSRYDPVLFGVPGSRSLELGCFHGATRLVDRPEVAPFMPLPTRMPCDRHDTFALLNARSSHEAAM